MTTRALDAVLQRHLTGADDIEGAAPSYTSSRDVTADWVFEDRDTAVAGGAQVRMI